MLIWSKGKAAVAILAAVTFVAAGVFVTSDAARGQNAAAGAAGAELRQKAEARVRAAENVLTLVEQRVAAGAEPYTPSFAEVHAAAQRRLAEARIDATDDPVTRVRAAEQYVQQCRDMLARLEQRKGQDVSAIQLSQGTYNLADAEYLLAKMRRK